jgi:hypothetical protein
MIYFILGAVIGVCIGIVIIACMNQSSPPENWRGEEPLSEDDISKSDEFRGFM